MRNMFNIQVQKYCGRPEHSFNFFHTTMQNLFVLISKISFPSGKSQLKFCICSKNQTFRDIESEFTIKLNEQQKYIVNLKKSVKVLKFAVIKIIHSYLHKCIKLFLLLVRNSQSYFQWKESKSSRKIDMASNKKLFSCLVALKCFEEKEPLSLLPQK